MVHLKRDNYFITMTFISLSTILERKEYLAKMNNLPKHHDAGPLEARGLIQLHRLHRLKAGPACVVDCNFLKLNNVEHYFVKSNNVVRHFCPDFRVIKTFGGALAPLSPPPPPLHQIMVHLILGLKHSACRPHVFREEILYGRR